MRELRVLRQNERFFPKAILHPDLFLHFAVINPLHGEYFLRNAYERRADEPTFLIIYLLYIFFLSSFSFISPKGNKSNKLQLLKK